MSRKVDRWISFGRKRCKKDDHWYVLDFGKYLLCPICGHTKKQEPEDMTEYNCWIVIEPDRNRVEQWLKTH